MKPADLTLVPEGYCPACRQRLPGSPAKRVCASCGKGILRGHKFVFDGSTVRHRVCEQPDAYRPTAEPTGGA